MQKIVCIVLFLFHCFNSVAQSDSLIFGQWQNHLNLREANAITQSKKNIIVSTGKSIILIDKENLSTQILSKLDGLTQTYISLVKYDFYNNQLLVFYNNGVFNIITEEEVFYNNAIRDNTIITGDRKITDIHLVDANTAFITSAFGIMEYDLKKLEFKSTTFIPSAASAITSDQKYIYAALSDGLYRIEKSNKNKENFSFWQLLGSSVNLPALYECSNVEFFNGKLYAVINGNLMSAVADGKFTPVNIAPPSSNFKISWLSAESEHLAIGLKDNQFDSRSRFINKNDELISGGASCINRTLYGIEDEKGRIWYADEWRQIRYTNNLVDGCNRIEYDSPYSYESSHIEVGKNRVFFASGGATENFQLNFSNSGFYILEDDHTWRNFNSEFVPEIASQTQFKGVQTIMPHPKDDSLIYIGSYLDGLLELNQKTNTYTFYGEKEENGRKKSSLQSITGAAGQVRVAHIQFDQKENLWISNTGAPMPISVLTKEKTWHSFSVLGNPLIFKLAIDQENNKWFTTFGAGASLQVFNENNTISDPSDDRRKEINSTNSIIGAGSIIHCVAVDLDGEVWVGTSSGPIVFDCDPYSDKCEGSQRKVLQDSIPALLLETEEVFTIEIDGANRKWFGTANGIFVQSPDALTQIHHFTVDNSPLLDNRIVDLDFDGENGLMYISSKAGIQSYKTESTEGSKKNTNNTYAYPNPVRPDYQGPIAIKGLARDADVRITDLNGRLVFKTKANGGQVIWDGHDYSGRRVDTGVYLVFCANEKDLTVKDVVVTKILMIK